MRAPRLPATIFAAVLSTSMMPPAAATDVRIYLAEYRFDDPILTRMEAGGANPTPLDVFPIQDWLVVGVFVDVANDTVYWTHGSFNQGRIRKANLDGTNIQTLVPSLTNPRGLAVDVAGEKIYWSDTQDNAIYRADIDGSNVMAIAEPGRQPGRPTLDLENGHVYFGTFDGSGAGDIRRTALDGTSEVTVITGLYTPVAVALDVAQGKIYWADSNTSFVSNHIVRANLDGTDVEVLYDGEPTSSGFTGIALDLERGRLYWCDEITASEKGVWEANLDGSNATRIYESPSGWNAGAMMLVQGDEPTCVADLDGDGAVAFGDLLTLLAAWGVCPPGECVADLDGSGEVGFGDLLVLLAAWGPC